MSRFYLDCVSLENYSAGHPATSERFVAVEKTVEEIKRKAEAKLPLEPEY